MWQNKTCPRICGMMSARSLAITVFLAMASLTTLWAAALFGNEVQYLRAINSCFHAAQSHAIAGESIAKAVHELARHGLEWHKSARKTFGNQGHFEYAVVMRSPGRAVAMLQDGSSLAPKLVEIEEAFADELIRKNMDGSSRLDGIWERSLFLLGFAAEACVFSKDFRSGHELARLRYGASSSDLSFEVVLNEAREETADPGLEPAGNGPVVWGGIDDAGSVESHSSETWFPEWKEN